MNAEISHLHSKIAAISYRLDALASCTNVPDQPIVPGYLKGQVITSAAPVGPGTVINHSVFFPCDGGVYQYVDRNGVQHAVGTADYTGALVRAVSINTPNWVGLKGVLGAVDSHVHSISSPTGSEFAYFENDFCRARAGTFEVRDVDDVNNASCYLSPIKWETPYMQDFTSDRAIFGTDLNEGLYKDVQGSTNPPTQTGTEALKIGLYFAECFFYE